jgi:hypothetical protein
LRIEQTSIGSTERIQTIRHVGDAKEFSKSLGQLERIGLWRINRFFFGGTGGSGCAHGQSRRS